MAPAEGGHCGHVEDISDAALRGPGGALHVGHGPHLLGQHSALEGWSEWRELQGLACSSARGKEAEGRGWSRDQVRGQGKGLAK